MSNLITWLRAQLDDDERIATTARERDDGRWRVLHERCGQWCGTPCPDAQLCAAGKCNHCVVVGDDIHIYDEGGHGPGQAEHIARHDPARVLAEVDAKRRIIDLHQESTLGDTGIGAGDCASCTNEAWPCPTLRLLALPYADRPGYRDEWQPEATG